ncbi:uncharacterized protein B0T15DRAFT_510572 [Chaetomium strumarium]|uniref:Uncharacterized protein n=1 Tax=Chaetomium strumarium TaxID=1170767 RepID=A0AAJ0GW70_9PEZI|nr:hypothetical protein B0T15DRAFT_510572 [Chaetomium strumarium]
MSLTNGLYNIMASKNSAPPPYNKAAKLVMTVEVETVQLRDEETGEVLQTEKHYPYYPLIDRKVEHVGGGKGGGDDGPPLSSSSSPSSPARSRRSSNGSSKASFSSASSRLSPSSWWGWAGSSPSSDSSSGAGATELRQEEVDEQYEVLDGILEEEEANGIPCQRSFYCLLYWFCCGKKRVKFTSRPRGKPDNMNIIFQIC